VSKQKGPPGIKPTKKKEIDGLITQKFPTKYTQRELWEKTPATAQKNRKCGEKVGG